MFDEDDETRFPRITLWQFIRGSVSRFFLAAGWLLSWGHGIWSDLIFGYWMERLDALFGGKKASRRQKPQASQADGAGHAA
jgi:hypothetical protein